MPYGTFVAGGALAGLIGMAVMVNSQPPSASAQSIDTLMHPSSSVQPQSVTLQRDANLMFADTPSGQTPRAKRDDVVELPVGEFVSVGLETDSNLTGRLDAVSGDWLQLRAANGSRTWIDRRHVVYVMTVDPPANQ